MKRLAFAALACSALSLTFAAPVYAQTLAETLALAYETNPQLAAARAQQRQADEGYAQAFAGRLPNVSLGLSVTEELEGRGGQGFLNPPGRASYQGTISQPIYQGGRIGGQIDQALAQVEAGRENLRATEQQVLLGAVQAHLDVVRDKTVVEIRQNNLNVLSRQLQAARDRFEVGEITRTDVAQAEARLSGAQAQLSAAQAQLAASRAAYERVVGAMPEDPEAPEGLPELLPANLGDAAEAALSDNPQLVAARFQEEAARQQVRIARAALRPSLDLNLSSSESRESDFSGEGVGSTDITARVSIPLFTGGLNGSRVRQALAAEDQARLQVTVAQRQVIESVTNAWNNYLAAQAVIESSEQAVRANEIAFEGVEQEAFVGLRTTLDVLDAEQELLNSRLELVSAQRDFVVAAYALLQATGRLDAESLALPVETYDPQAHFEDIRFKAFDITPWN